MKIKKQQLILLFFLNTSLQAQPKQVTTQSIYWLRYYNVLSINDHLKWHNEFENRTFFENNKQHHFILHSRMHYKISNNADVALGLTYSLQNPQDPNSTSSLRVPELRPVQEFNYSNPINKRLTIQHRFRVEERFVSKNNGKELLDGYDFNFRFRYRLQANYKLLMENRKTNTTIKVFNELMINAGNTIIYNQFDQNRMYVGLEQELNKNFSIELGYLNWYQQRSSGFQFFDRDIIRFTINHKLKL